MNPAQIAHVLFHFIRSDRSCHACILTHIYMKYINGFILPAEKYVQNLIINSCPSLKLNKMNECLN